MIDVARNRLIAAVVLLAALAPLLVAARLHPAAGGMGTHEQMGLPPCGFLAVTGLPCATCGMTTAFAHAAHGRLAAAFITQPAGTLLCVAAAAVAVVAAWAIFSGMSLRGLGATLGRPRVIFTGLGVVLLSWGYNILAHLA